MKKIRFNIFVILVALFSMFSIAYAADVSISTGSATVEKGQTASVSVSLSSGSAIGAYEFVIRYDPSVIEYVKSPGDDAFCNGGNGVLKIVDSPMASSQRYTLKFKAVAAGKSALKVEYSAGNILDGNFDNMNVKAANGTITVNNPREVSKDNNLASLKVGQGALSPAFAAGTLEYSIPTVSADVKSLTISANPASPYAKVAISGNDLKAGDNVVSITVTAENGDKKIYKIKVSVLAATPTPSPEPTATPTQGTTLNANTYGIDENGKLTVGTESLVVNDKITVAKPEGFDNIKLEIGGFTIGGLKLNDGNLTLVQLSDDKLYVYDPNDNTVYPYVTYKTLTRNYLIVEAPDDSIPSGYKLTGFEADGVVYPAYCINPTDEFMLIYLSDGKWYKYDTVDNTVQRYDASEKQVIEVTVIPSVTVSPTFEPATPTEAVKVVKKESKKEKLIRLAVTGVIFVLAIIFMILYVIEKHRNLQILKEEEEDAMYEAEDSEPRGIVDETSNGCETAEISDLEDAVAGNMLEEEGVALLSADLESDQHDVADVEPEPVEDGTEAELPEAMEESEAEVVISEEMETETTPDAVPVAETVEPVGDSDELKQITGLADNEADDGLDGMN